MPPRTSDDALDDAPVIRVGIARQPRIRWALLIQAARVPDDGAASARTADRPRGPRSLAVTNGQLAGWGLPLLTEELSEQKLHPRQSVGPHASEPRGETLQQPELAGRVGLAAPGLGAVLLVTEEVEQALSRVRHGAGWGTPSRRVRSPPFQQRSDWHAESTGEPAQGTQCGLDPAVFDPRQPGRSDPRQPRDRPLRETALQPQAGDAPADVTPAIRCCGQPSTLRRASACAQNR